MQALKSDGNVSQSSRFEVCKYISYGTPSDCTNKYSGHWNPIFKGGCYRATDCFPNQFCTVAESSSVSLFKKSIPYLSVC